MYLSSETKIKKIVQTLLIELRGNQKEFDIPLNHSIQNHFGIDSIGKAELFHRIEQAFVVEFSTSFMANADTLNDIMTALKTMKPEISSLEKNSDQAIITERSEDEIDLTKVETLVDVLKLHAQIHPDRTHLIFEDEDHEEIISYGKLLKKSLEAAQGFLKLGANPGDTIAIMLPTSPAFFYTFFGILLAGCVPVPLYPPTRLNQLEAYTKQEAKILRNCEARILITFKEAKMVSKLFKAFVPSLKHVTVFEELPKAGDQPLPLLQSDEIALIQYTSGSTNTPKGVALTHKSLLANIRAYGKALAATSKDIVISWLPLYHDLGLIGHWLGSVYFGPLLVAFSPLTFLNRPEKWLWSIHYHRGTISSGPNFAYETCVQKINPTKIEGLDLSSWRIAINGAEPVQTETLERFIKKFSSYGFKAESFFPVYGLAETCLGLTAPPSGPRLPLIDVVDRKVVENDRRANPSTSTDKNEILKFVSCGQVLEGQHLRIVNEHNQDLPPRHIGHLQFQGPSSMQGYYNNPTATDAANHNGWWDTGDLAYQADDEIYITGRSKDVIIKAGRNLYPSEIESITAEIHDIRKGCVVAFGLNDTKLGTEKLIVVAETRETNQKKHPAIIKQINEKLSSFLNFVPDEIVLVQPRTVPKTSSGKLQRSACKLLYQQKKLNKKPLRAELQFLKIGLSWTAQTMRKFLLNFARFVFTLFLGLFIAVTVIPILLSVKLTSRNIAAKIFKVWNKAIVFFSFCPIKVKGKDNLSKNSPMIFVSNHQSYADAVLLTSILPTNVLFVGKKELFSVPILSTLFRKLGYISVNKNIISQGLEDMKDVEIALKKGFSVLIFAEGTFNYAAGLRPFKLGAFKIAAELNIPICPLALSGTRYFLRGNEYWMLPHKFNFTASKPIYSKGKSFADIVRLKEETRAEIANNCDEVTLDLIIPAATGIKKMIKENVY